MTEELVLYTHPMSRGRIARWMLEEVGVPYTVEALLYGESMKAPAYLALNPMGKVPALRHGAAVVTEVAAICAYLAAAFPAAGLEPAGTDRAAYYRWLFFAAGPLEAAITNKSLGVELTDRQKVFVGYGSLAAALNTLEAAAASAAPYICGATFSAADVYFGSQIGFGLQFKSFEATPAVQTYWDRIKDRPAAVRARALDDAMLPPPPSA